MCDAIKQQITNYSVYVSKKYKVIQIVTVQLINYKEVIRTARYNGGSCYAFRNSFVTSGFVSFPTARVFVST